MNSITLNVGALDKTMFMDLNDEEANEIISNWDQITSVIRLVITQELFDLVQSKTSAIEDAVIFI